MQLHFSNLTELKTMQWNIIAHELMSDKIVFR